MITLYTPATGFPDLEIKIAYGLARVGIEAFGMEKVTIYDNGGFYTVLIDTNEKEFAQLNKTFNMLCKRLLSSPYIAYNTPGITGRSAEKISIAEEEIFSLDTYKFMKYIAKNSSSENVCRHNINSVGNVIGLTATTSYHHKRDGLDILVWEDTPRRPTNPQNICKICGLLSLIGIWYASFIFSVAGRKVVVLPIPRQKLTGSKLQAIFALQHQLRKDWIKQEIPQVLIPLTFLSKIPSSADILNGFDLFIAVLSRQQVYHVDGLFLIPIENYLNFIRHSSYNVASVELILAKEAYGSLQELNNAIYYRKIDSLAKFARVYVQETSPKKGEYVNLLYPETAKYLLKEVAMIKSEIIENQALSSLARTLRYFIQKKKYGYADDIRNARKNSGDFEDTIAKMLREGRLRLEQKEKIHLPNDEEIKEIFRLANEDFESTKLALVILAFSFPAKAEQAGEEENG